MYIIVYIIFTLRVLCGLFMYLSGFLSFSYVRLLQLTHLYFTKMESLQSTSLQFSTVEMEEKIKDMTKNMFTNKFRIIQAVF